MTRLRVAMLAFAAASCAADEPPEQLTHQFRIRPVELVASTALPDQCIDSLVAAVLWWRDQGATFSLRVSEPWAPVLNELVVAGQVGVIPGKLGVDQHGRDVRAKTEHALSLNGDIIGALVTLDRCDLPTVAHELGHALGGVHIDEPGNLLYEAVVGGGWDLTDEQREWFQDPYSVVVSR